MLDGFCEYLRRQGKSENTVKAYCQGMKEYMRWHEETFGKRMKLFLLANVRTKGEKMQAQKESVKGE